MLKWLEGEFPNLSTVDCEILDERTRRYNCIAWAVGDKEHVWNHLSPYWMGQRTSGVEALVALFRDYFYYEVCSSFDAEPGYEKVAVYVDADGNYTHAAKLLDDGRWTSKLGDLWLISHPSPQSLAGGFYGDLHCIMRRPSSGEST